MYKVTLKFTYNTKMCKVIGNWDNYENPLYLYSEVNYYNFYQHSITLIAKLGFYEFKILNDKNE